MMHFVFDSNTGETKIIGRDGTAYSDAEIADAYRRAERGDPRAVAVIDNITQPTPTDPEAWLEQVIHDCPECQASRARGERPRIEILPRPRKVKRRVNRWRTRRQPR